MEDIGDDCFCQQGVLYIRLVESGQEKWQSQGEYGCSILELK